MYVYCRYTITFRDVNHFENNGFFNKKNIYLNFIFKVNFSLL